MIISFQNRHWVSENAGDDPESILQFVHETSGWPLQYLQVQSQSVEYTVVRTVSCIRGGKGGFGSLLKSQSRQAGARSTTNFGMCRDLQGRRLRHVNDALASKHFNEWKRKIEAGEASEEDHAKSLVNDTESGIPGWHLQLPTWGEGISKKETSKWKRQFHLWKREREMAKQFKEEEKQRREARVNHYVEEANQASQSVRSSLQSALQEGLKQREKKQQHARTQSPTSSSDPSKRLKQHPDPPTALLTLSGDIVLAYENGFWQVQSQSNFCTLGIVLDGEKLSSSCKGGIYWEAKLVTGGLAQIGWAAPDPQQFKPQSDTGDGVGDDEASFAYDGSRNIFLHKSESKVYRGERNWREGDIVGCLLQSGVISFSLNGTDLGPAYESTPDRILFPAASCNPKEILELRLYRSEMQFMPDSCNPVGELLATEDVTFEQEVGDVVKQKNDDQDSKEAVKDENPPVVPQLGSPNQSTSESLEPINLDDFSSAKDLESVGLDRLKTALITLGVKCGGTLQQRAERLFSLKGLSPRDFPSKLLAKKKK